jgi:hypothetical protein
MSKETDDYNDGANGNPFASGWGEVAYEQQKRLNQQSATNFDTGSSSTSGGTSSSGNSHSGGYSGASIVGAGAAIMVFLFVLALPLGIMLWFSRGLSVLRRLVVAGWASLWGFIYYSGFPKLMVMLNISYNVADDHAIFTGLFFVVMFSFVATMERRGW